MTAPILGDTARPVIRSRFDKDWLVERMPLFLVPVLALAGLLLVGAPSTWATLTVAGLAMGMMIFVMASGLTLVFGLMDVLNFGHGAFISLGAYTAVSVLLSMAGFTASASIWVNLAAVGPAIAAAVVVTAAAGWFFERVLIMPVYGSHLKQILITMGGLIVTEQLIVAVWGPHQIPIPRPAALQGSVVLGEFAVETYRLYAMLLGLAVFGGMALILNRTRLGCLVRAGVENGEMVEALGYRIRRLFVAVFMAGSALAGLGGVLWALYEQVVTAQMGMNVMILVFIVIIIGGLGSVGGCFIGALLVGLMANYTGYLVPKIALFSNIGLMVLVLMWRPQGLYPVVKAK